MMEQSVDQLARQAFDYSKREVLVHLRFLNGASTLLRPLPIVGSTLATDGVHMRYDPKTFAKSYAANPSAAARSYLHVLLHNVFLHLYVSDEVDALCWDTACDIAVERAITQLNLGSAFEVRFDAQQAIIERFDDLAGHATAESIYRALMDANLTTEELEEMREPFVVDDHAPWHRMAVSEDNAARKDEGVVSEGDAQDGSRTSQGPGPAGTDMDIPEEAKNAQEAHKARRGRDAQDIVQKEAPKDARVAVGQRFADTVQLDRSKEQWEHAALEMGVAMDSYGDLYGAEGANLSMNLNHVVRKKRSYREFLRKFTTQGEHIKVNPDEFDYVYYCFGLDHYGNLPLIEPLEYTEERRIRDFVIAIDTSSSTKDGLVRRFLETTSSILSNEDSFFSDMNVLIVQCDAEVTDVARIRERRDFDDYLRNLQIKGLGGTDFRPVFAYVDDLVAAGDLANLAGVVYLTDGFGTYPSKPPDYQTAFIFVDDEAAAAATVPSWAMKAVLEDEEALRARRRPAHVK